MSIILGFLNKNYDSEINDKYIENSINDLTLNGKRHLQKVKYDNITFCHAQLSGEQEVRIVENEDKSLLLIMGGEIFDYKHKLKELRNLGHKFKYPSNPAEFILHSFEESGRDIFKNLNGNFAIAVWDQTNKLLIVANDTFGFHPLFIYDSKEAFIFCSEYQPILRYSNFRSDLNYDAIAEYFIVGAVLRNKTFFKQVNNLPPATILELKNNTSRLNTYETLNIEIQRDKPIAFFAEQIEGTFKNAVRVRVEDHRINPCCLSGGLDTRFILGCLSSKDRGRMQFYTYTSHLKENEDKDVICSKILAEKFKLKQYFIKHQDRGDFNEKIFEDLRFRVIKYELWGLFGGELLGGQYLKAFTFLNKAYINNMLPLYFTKNFINKTDGLTDIYLFSQLNKSKTVSKNKKLFFSIEMLTKSFLSSIYKGFSEMLYPTRFFLNYRRYPFLDKEVLKILLTIPPEYLQNYNLYLEIMKTRHPDLMLLPIASGGIRDSRVKYFKKGKTWFRTRKNKYNKYLGLCLKGPTVWGKSNYNICFYRKMKLKVRILRCLTLDSINDIAIIRFLIFEAWLRKYYINQERSGY